MKSVATEAVVAAAVGKFSNAATSVFPRNNSQDNFIVMLNNADTTEVMIAAPVVAVAMVDTGEDMTIEGKLERIKQK